MELLIGSGYISHAKLSKLMAEANEIIAMTVASIKTIRGGKS
jgi:hypothetical protein